MMKNELEKAIRDIREGKMVLVYDFDDRERETDMVLASEFMTQRASGRCARLGEV